MPYLRRLNLNNRRWSHLLRDSHMKLRLARLSMRAKARGFFNSSKKRLRRLCNSIKEEEAEAKTMACHINTSQSRITFMDPRRNR
jgi:hypothetical protein